MSPRQRPDRSLHAAGRSTKLGGCQNQLPAKTEFMYSAEPKPPAAASCTPLEAWSGSRLTHMGNTGLECCQPRWYCIPSSQPPCVGLQSVVAQIQNSAQVSQSPEGFPKPTPYGRGRLDRIRITPARANLSTIVSGSSATRWAVSLSQPEPDTAAATRRAFFNLRNPNDRSACERASSENPQ